MFCGILSALTSLAQDDLPWGRDFWVVVPYDVELIGDSVSLYIIGDTACTGYVENSFYNYHEDFNLTPGTPTIVKVPMSVAAVSVDYNTIVQQIHNNVVFAHQHGVYVNTTHAVGVYLQYVSRLDHSASTMLSPFQCHNSSLFPYSPLSCDTRILTYKIPIYPLQYLSLLHQIEEEALLMSYNGSTCSQAMFFVGITAQEDSTMVYSHRIDVVNQEVRDDTIALHQAGESTIIPLHFSTDFHFKTNCKSAAVYYFEIPNFSSLEMAYAMGEGMLYPICWLVPLSRLSRLYSGHDYLCKKLSNNRFDKGVALGGVFSSPVLNNGTVVDVYLYNEYHPDYSLDNFGQSIFYINYIRGLLTGNHHPYYGDTTQYVDVPYSFIRSQTPRLYDQPVGPIYLVAKQGLPMSHTQYGITTHYEGCIRDIMHHSLTTQPTERMVKEWVYPTTRDNLKRTLVTTAGDTVFVPCDSLYVDVQIYTHADGIGSTYFNGQLIPPTAFDSFPMTNGEYWVTQLYFYNDDIPEIIRIENEHGFSAYVDEFGYNVGPAPAGHHEIDDITYLYYYHSGASGCYSTEAYQDNHTGLSLHNGDTVYRCVNDTLQLRVEHNPDSVPVEWIFEGDSYPYPELFFPLTQVDTLAVQLIFHYDGCPDTSTTFVVVVPPPVFTYCHDDTLCHGAQLSVEQPNVLSYQWSTGAHTPAITLDSAGTYSVTVTNLGCKAESDLFTIDLYPQSSVEFGSDSILCELATLLLDATQPHPAQYVWQDQSTNTTYTVYEDGQYWVVVTDHCLGASDTIAVGYLTDFTVDLGPDTTLCEGRTLTLSAGVPFCDYEWQDGSTQPTYIVRHPGIYSVTASNKCFEHGDDITVEYEPCDQELWMPNSFTPDGDGLNDLFLPVFSYPDEVESYEMTIYDRWGMVMFDTKSKEQGWDAAGVPIGAYVVFVRYKSRGHETRDVTGSVTVVRY
ncbi:MAG: gliding motility-associated C-terminal domain-containing protein [Bacteroidales bacterium]|nr:gliding motility-associated C-terminal domain-containing protein [Bacteroidales bacterium]